MAKAVTLQWPSMLQRQWKLPKTASVAALQGDWITIASGYAKRGISTTPYLVGLLSFDWVNDANNTPVSITCDEHGVYIMDITGGPLVQATHVGNAYDLSDERTLNLAGTTYKVARVIGISPDGRAYVVINSSWIGSGLA